ncbi:hypothetical protein [Kordia sp.]|uniref:hypothetical protein n=1 Tax=Kordia sp. TaxID=1965332 RepID=UPI003D6AAC1E
MKKNIKELRLKKSKVAKLNTDFIKGRGPGVDVYSKNGECTTEIDKTCTETLPVTNLKNKCNETGEEGCLVVSG